MNGVRNRARPRSRLTVRIDRRSRRRVSVRRRRQRQRGRIRLYILYYCISIPFRFRIYFLRVFISRPTTPGRGDRRRLVETRVSHRINNTILCITIIISFRIAFYLFISSFCILFVRFFCRIRLFFHFFRGQNDNNTEVSLQLFENSQNFRFQKTTFRFLYYIILCT